MSWPPVCAASQRHMNALTDRALAGNKWNGKEIAALWWTITVHLTSDVRTQYKWNPVSGFSRQSETSVEAFWGVLRTFAPQNNLFLLKSDLITVFLKTMSDCSTQILQTPALNQLQKGYSMTKYLACFPSNALSRARNAELKKHLFETVVTPLTKRPCRSFSVLIDTSWADY